MNVSSPKDLRKFLDSNHIIRDGQFGFHHHRNITLQRLRVAESISEHYNIKIYKVGTVFLVLLKAFDLVWPNGLIYKLIQTRVQDWITDITHDYLCKRNFTVKYKHSTSRHYIISAVVSQRFQLPLLFSISTFMTPLIINKCKKKPT